jgi:type IV pilus assembly protein PilC
MDFKYKAMNVEGKIITGKLASDNPDDLEIRLQHMGLDLISFREQRRQNFRFASRISRQDLITFCFYMDQLLRAGVPLLQGLQDLRDTLTDSKFRDILSSLYEDVQAGKTLSQALLRFPSVFDTVFINLVHIGEESGELSQVFKHLTESLKWQDELIAQTKKLLLYPAFTAVVILGMVLFMMMWLVPQLVVFMKNMVGKLPPQTQMLVDISDFLVNYWYVVLMTPIILIFLFVLGLKISFRFRLMVDDFKLRIWVIGPIFKKIILARFAGFFALMYGAGITVLESLSIIAKTSNNLAIEEAIKSVQANIADGVSISQAFHQSKLFPPLVVRMLQIGEVTGALDDALKNVSYFYDREVRESIGKIQAMIEPMLILILGAIMAWLILSVLGPIYDIITTSSMLG